MTQILTIRYDPKTQFCPLEFKYNRRFHDLIRTGVKPVSYRKYNQERKTWSVHISKLPFVIALGRRYFAHVNYSDLPDAIQIQIVQQLQEGRHRDDLGPFPAATTIALTPHQVLHLLPSAPPEVVKASYRALVSLHHPDHGGSADDFRAIQEAYESLTGKSSREA